MNEAGQIGTAKPVKILVDPSKPLPRVPQYPLRPEAEEGIAPVIDSLTAQGVIVPVSSLCNTPIFPVKKPGKNTYRFVQDPRAVNAAVLPSFPVVPNQLPFSLVYPLQPLALLLWTFVQPSFLFLLSKIANICLLSPIGNVNTLGPGCLKGILNPHLYFLKSSRKTSMT